MWRVENVSRVEEKKKLISLPSVKQIHSANIFLCRVTNNYTRQIYFFVECICLSSVSTNGHSTNVLTDGTRTNGCPRGGSLPSAQLLPSVFFSGLPSAKLCRVFFASFTECNYFAECFFYSTRQRASLPSARQNALGKHSCTQQTSSFRQW